MVQGQDEGRRRHADLGPEEDLDRRAPLGGLGSQLGGGRGQESVELAGGHPGQGGLADCLGRLQEAPEAVAGPEENGDKEAQPQQSSRRGGRRDRDNNRRDGRRDNRRDNRGERRDRPPQPTISDLLREGQEILVQIAKEPIAKKGARITSHIALPGRLLVYMPTVNHVGVSRKIPSDAERDTAAAQMPPGFIEMRQAFGREGEYGKWLRQLPATIKINDIVFAHGGISPAVAPMGCAAINDQVRRELGDDLDKTRAAPLESLAARVDGPLWYRGLAQEPD